MALGNILKEARMRKKLSASEVAAITRMKIQLVQAIELEDYSSFPATIYGKGFIKLFAECVDVDPTPLIEEYISAVSSGNITQPAPTPRRKPRKILIDTEPLVDDIAKDNKKDKDKSPVQPALPIENKTPNPKPATEKKIPTDDLFSRIETEKTKQEKPLYHPEKTSEPTKEVKANEEVNPIIKDDPVEKEIPVKEPVKIIEPASAPVAQKPLYAPKSEEEEKNNSKPVEQEAAAEIGPIPVINHISPSTISKPIKKETKNIPLSTPMKKLTTDASLSLKNLNLSESHIKAASISAGILILLILMTTTISRCSRGKKETAPPANNTLQLAIPPADPYLE